MRRGFGPSEFRLTVRMLHSLLYSIHDCISSSSVAAPMAYDVGRTPLSMRRQSVYRFRNRSGRQHGSGSP